MRNPIWLVLLILPLVGLLLQMPEAGADAEKGQKPPEISATEWVNTKPLKLAHLKGKVVVVEFWATWCGPCVQSIPHLKELHAKYKDKGMVLVSLTDEDPAAVKPFIKKMKMDYRIGLGSNTAEAYGVTGIPHAVVIGKNGKIAWSGHPMDGLDKAVADALK